MQKYHFQPPYLVFDDAPENEVSGFCDAPGTRYYYSAPIPLNILCLRTIYGTYLRKSHTMNGGSVPCQGPEVEWRPRKIIPHAPEPAAERLTWVPSLGEGEQGGCVPPILRLKETDNVLSPLLHARAHPLSLTLTSYRRIAMRGLFQSTYTCYSHKFRANPVCGCRAPVCSLRGPSTAKGFLSHFFFLTHSLTHSLVMQPVMSALDAISGTKRRFVANRSFKNAS